MMDIEMSTQKVKTPKNRENLKAVFGKNGRFHSSQNLHILLDNNEI